MESGDILSHLARLGDILQFSEPVEIVLIGGAAGILTGQFSAGRVTRDCDVIRYVPNDAQEAVLVAARQVARENGLPEDWLNSKAMTLDILPDGWHVRKVPVGTFGQLHVVALSRQDLLATKFYAAFPRDVEDITAMAPTPKELRLVRTYLTMLRVPSRQADLDQVNHAMALLRAFSGEGDE